MSSFSDSQLTLCVDILTFTSWHVNHRDCKLLRQHLCNNFTTAVHFNYIRTK